MEKKKTDQIRIDPSQRSCTKFDHTSIAMFPIDDRQKMGVRVLDDCAEEHIM